MWLEEVQGEDALGWVREQNKVALDRIGDPEGSASYDRILSILDSKDKIPHVRRIGKDGEELYYNFWTDDSHRKGIWRRTTLESFKTEAPEWEEVLDVDALAEAEGISWVWHGADVLDEGDEGAFDIALLTLSPGGSDASVVREFNLITKKFIPPEDGGFYVPEAKSSVGYRSRDELLVGTDFGEGSMTDSGYPRTCRSWKRGTPLEDATLIYDDALKEDISAGQYLYFDRGVWHEFKYRSMTFYTSEQFYRAGDPHTASAEGAPFVKVPVQDDASVSTFRDSATITLRSDWAPDGAPGNPTYAAGSLLALPLSELMEGNFANITQLFEPSARTSLESNTGTRNFMVLCVLDNVKASLKFWRYGEGGTWSLLEGGGDVPVGCNIHLSAVHPDATDEVFVTRYGYIEPDTMSMGSVANGLADTVALKARPHMFDAAGLTVQQFMATSADGTQVPYFVQHRKDIALDGSHPTLLDGYGGFEISMTPSYSAAVGASWLEKGGIKVIGCIRGGGEFGPTWHQAALKEKRYKAFEDYEAVARDLIERGFTSPRHLACIGGSNGGLLVGNMLTRQGAALFGSIVCQVPLLDMFRYHKLLAGASWMAEYGDPEKPEEWEFLQNHSPYQRLQDVCLKEGSTWECPEVLFTTSTKDDRVHPGHARKMVKALLDIEAAAPRVSYWENIEGGHGGAADNKQRAYMWALTYNFLWKTIGAGAAKL